MNYDRVIPRDFFNEAKLLKCMGTLSLKILDQMLPEGIDIEIVDTYGQPFEVEMHEAGLLYVPNYTILINGKVAIMGTRYNSKSNYPFVYYTGDNEEIEVFDESGNFDTEFINHFKKRA